MIHSTYIVGDLFLPEFVWATHSWVSLYKQQYLKQKSKQNKKKDEKPYIQTTKTKCKRQYEEGKCVKLEWFKWNDLLINYQRNVNTQHNVAMLLTYCCLTNKPPQRPKTLCKARPCRVKWLYK